MTTLKPNKQNCVWGVFYWGTKFEVFFLPNNCFLEKSFLLKLKLCCFTFEIWLNSSTLVRKNPMGFTFFFCKNDNDKEIQLLSFIFNFYHKQNNFCIFNFHSKRIILIISEINVKKWGKIVKFF